MTTRFIDVSVTGGVISFDVASGMTQRSWIDALDILFASPQIAENLLNNPARVTLSKFALVANGPNIASTSVSVPFGGAASLTRTGNNLRLNFGSGVIGNSGRNSIAADGYYRLDLDFEGDGAVDTTKYFYRLLGDVNGDRKVDSGDVSLVQAGMAKPYNRELDINGDTLVNGLDRYWTQAAVGRRLRTDLFLND